MTETSLYISDIQELSTAEYSTGEKMLHLKRLLDRLAKDITREETLQFPNLFSRLVFIAQKYNLSKQMEWRLQHFRVRAGEIRRHARKKIDPSEYRVAERTILDLCQIISGQEAKTAESTVAEPTVPDENETLRVQILNIDKEKKEIRCIDEHTATEIVVKYGVNPDNRLFDESVDRFWNGAQLNVIDCSIDRKGRFVPKYIVLEPDYLIDASAIAECFQNYGTTPLHYFQNKFDEVENRSYILLGNLANFFLDELVFAENPERVSFDETFLRSFKQSPFEYTSCEDIRSVGDFQTFMTKATEQFNNIRRVVTKDFPQRGIDVHRCTLEPSFYSEKFGFQGRLDLLQTGDKHSVFKIVELKSGRLPYPSYDTGKISLNHEVQTAVYRLMIESVYSKTARNIDAAILYSAGNNAGENLRFAAVFRELEKQIINLRNLIVANEHTLTHGSNNDVAEKFEELFGSVDTGERLPDFYTQKIAGIQTVLVQCSGTELAYFYRYIRFISRELYLQKIGDIEYESPSGVASLWNSDFTERAEALDVLYDLSIENIDDTGNGMTIVFRRHHADNDIVNFREGEICIVYPRNDDSDNVLNTQILKGNIAALKNETVEVYFRYKQKNKSFFTENERWAIEHDVLDSSYNSMYRSLFSFLNASVQKRNLLLGFSAPAAKDVYTSAKSYPENIIEQALAAEDYFLIVGPPGTGKTSIFARRLIEEYYKTHDVNILVLAYTNRAVDELCGAVNAAFGCEQSECEAYIRIGTELSCAEPYRNRLLQHVSEQAKSREQLRNKIESTRIYISTLASITGRMELFALKHFHVAIVDEASQILEPQLIGLLPKFDKFILIGDHNQLSTIVLQKPLVSAVHEPELNEIGITDCRDSLFERMLRACKNNEWKHAYAQLSYQGRMHEEIAAFPAQFFYDNNLFTASVWQRQPWDLTLKPEHDIFHRCVAKKRVMLFSTEHCTQFNTSGKINETEAAIVVKLAETIYQVYENNQRPFNPERLGIITPYRNQIALIKHKLAKADIPGSEKIMVDTVERFQGSQRDVILVSFCVNKPYQLNFLSNPSHDGKVDRKLNVTLTRARQQLFMVGNRQILKKHPIYTTLLEFLRQDTVAIEKDDI